MNAAHRFALSVTACLPLLAMSTVALADALPPDAAPCDQRPDGDACDGPDGKGTCQPSTCNGIDYANWDRDASATPPTKTYACLKCVAADGGASKTGSDGGTPTTPTTDGSTNGGSSSTDDGGCSVAGRAGVRDVAPWLLALAVPALVSATKRRRARR